MMSPIKIIKKACVFIVGIIVVIIGIILLPLPGPGLLIIAGGLLILSSEFNWAERHLATVKNKIKKLLDLSKSKQDDKKK